MANQWLYYVLTDDVFLTPEELDPYLTANPDKFAVEAWASDGFATDPVLKSGVTEYFFRGLDGEQYEITVSGDNLLLKDQDDNEIVIGGPTSVSNITQDLSLTVKEDGVTALTGVKYLDFNTSSGIDLSTSSSGVSVGLDETYLNTQIDTKVSTEITSLSGSLQQEINLNKSRSYITYSFGENKPGLKCRHKNWTVMAVIIFKGKNIVGTPSSISVLGLSTEDDSDCEIKIYDALNNKIIAEDNSLLPNDYDDDDYFTKTISLNTGNITSNESIWEIQLKRSEGNFYLFSLDINF